MCFSPQRRAIFRQQNVKKCSEDYSFLTFSLANVLFTTAACNFSTAERQKVLRRLQFFNILTSKCAFRHSGVQFFKITTYKSGPNTSCFVHFHFHMCFSPQGRAFFQHQNWQKWSKHVMFCTFSLPNVLFATGACNFSTSELPKVVQTCGVLYIFTSKCAFRHSGVQFFKDYHVQRWSKHAVFCTFSLQNVLFATAACNFSRLPRTKVVQTCGVLYIFTSKCAFRHSGVQFLISPLSSYLRTRRFNRPTFGLTRHTNHWKNTAFRDFSNIWRGCIFFLLTLTLLHLLSTDLTTLLLLFNSPYCRKFLFK